MFKTNADILFEEFLKHEEFKNIPNKEQLNYRDAIESNNPLLRALASLIIDKETKGYTGKDSLQNIIINIKRDN